MPLTSHARDADTVRIDWTLPTDAAGGWAALTDMDRLPLWLGRATSGSFAAGETLVVDHGDETLCTSRVGVCEPGRELAMTWEFPGEPASDLVIRLEDAGQGCVLRLVHSGLGALAGGYLAGWVTHLTFLESAVRGEALPQGAYWFLHSTFETLTHSEEHR